MSTKHAYTTNVLWIIVSAGASTAVSGIVAVVVVLNIGHKWGGVASNIMEVSSVSAMNDCKGHIPGNNY